MAKDMTTGSATGENAADPNKIAKQLTDKVQADQKRKKNLLKSNVDESHFEQIDKDLARLEILNKLPQDQRGENWGKLVDYYNANIKEALDNITEEAGIE